MFQAIAVNLMLKALCQIMCQFLGICCDQKDCPDGVCEPLIDQLEAIQADVPEVSANPAKVSAVGFSPDWSKLPELVDAIKTLVKSIIAFLNKQDEISVG